VTVPITLERTPIEKQIYAKTLLDNQQSVQHVAKVLGMDRATITKIRDKQTYSASMLEEFKRRLPFKAYQLADNVLDLIDPSEIKKAPLGTKMVAFGVAIDKARDMEGSNRPVVNIVTMVGDLSSRLTDIKRKQQAIEAFEASQ